MVGLLFFDRVALSFSTLLLLIPWLIFSDQIEELRPFKIYILLILGFLTRLAFSPFFVHRGDLELIQTAADMLLQGESPYSRTEVTYPPLINYTEALVILLAGKGVFYFKLPTIISEIILGFVIYKMSREYTNNERLAYWTSALFLLNPWIYFQTIVFGHFDSIPTLFMVLAIYLLIKERPKFSAVSLGIGIMYKIFPVVIFPIIVIYFIRQKRWQRMIEYIIIVAIVCVITSLPFLIISYEDFISKTLHIVGVAPRGLAIHRVLIYFVLRAGMSKQIVYSVMGILQVAGLLISWLLFISRKTVNAKFALLEESTFFLLIFLLFSRFLQEQYATWVIPFLILYFLIKNPVSPQLGDMVLYYAYTCAPFFYRVVKWRVWFSLYDDFSFVFFSTFILSILFYHFVGWLIAVRFFRKCLPKDIFQSAKDKLTKLTKWLHRNGEKGTNNANLRSYMKVLSLQIDFSILYGAIVTGMIIVMFIFQGKTDISFELFLFPIMILSVVIAALLRSGLLISGIKTSNAIYTFINFWIVYIFEVGIYFHTDFFTILVRAFLIALSSSLGYILISLIENFRRGESLIDLIFR